jgi:GDP-D-mannose dehydratase
MVSEKVLRFQGKNMDLDQLSQKIAQQLQAEGYKIQTTKAPLGNLIQAQKAGILRDIITAERAFTILISGQPNDFTIRVGIGKLVQNLAVAAAEALLLSELFLAVDVPEMLWTRHVEGQLVREIQEIVG